jgi:transposase-like protein
MTSPRETYSAAIIQACQAHLARVKAARDTRDLAVSKVKNPCQHEHPRRALAVYDAANEAYEKARRDSDAQRAKDDADALAAFQATGEVL